MKKRLILIPVFIGVALLVVVFASRRNELPADVEPTLDSLPTPTPIPTPEQRDSSPTPSLPLPTPAPTITAPALTPPPQQPSPLRRQDAPPAGVEAQLGLYTPYISACPYLEGEVTGPALNLWSTDVEIAERVFFCLEGFSPGQEVTLTLTRPDGSTWEAGAAIGSFGTGELPWLALPGDPVGEYQVSARQNEVEARATLTVRPASEPHIAVLTPAMQPGETVQVALAGFRPEQQLYLYKAAPCAEDETLPCRIFLTALPLPALNDRGEAILELPTRPDDPQGEYALITDNYSVDDLQDETFTLVAP